jgi:hypothetical protein
MSEPVSLDALQETIAALPPDAFLMTVGEGGAVHVVSAAPRFDGERLLVAAGRSSRANAAAQPAVTLLWPRADDRYCLIVDGTVAEATEAGLSIEPTKAILHRLATADPSLPNCVTVGSA